MSHFTIKTNYRDQDRFINEMTEEALQDLLKKYREKSKGK